MFYTNKFTVKDDKAFEDLISRTYTSYTDSPVAFSTEGPSTYQITEPVEKFIGSTETIGCRVTEKNVSLSRFYSEMSGILAEGSALIAVDDRLRGMKDTTVAVVEAGKKPRFMHMSTILALYLHGTAGIPEQTKINW